MAAYLVVDVQEVTDPDGFGSYREQVVPLVERYGGQYLAVDHEHTVLEGEWEPGVVVLIQFPTMARLQEWYESAEYAPLKELRLGCSQCTIVAVNGVE